jgi:AraC-like DNA-binding protein
VKQELQNHGFEIQSIVLGKVELKQSLSDEEILTIKKVLKENEFELLEDRQHQLVEIIKTRIIEHVHHHKEKPETLNFSDFLSQETGVNYSQLSRLFSSIEGITIEKYIILQKIEYAKEALAYGEKNLSEISFELGYSSVAHLSGQFKKITGLTPTAFKKAKDQMRKSLDDI